MKDEKAAAIRNHVDRLLYGENGPAPELVEEFGIPLPVLTVERSGSHERADGTWGPSKPLVSSWVADS